MLKKKLCIHFFFVFFFPLVDTAQNRKDMPGSNFADWTPLEHVADLLLSWSSDSAKRPSNGALLQIDTKAGSTSIKEVKEQF